MNEVQNYTFASKKFHVHIDKIERENINNKIKWLGKIMEKQHRILKLRRQIKNVRLQKQVLARTVNKMLSKRKDTFRLLNRRRSMQCIEITNIQQNITNPIYEALMESNKCNEQFNIDIDNDITLQSNDVLMKVTPQADNQEETIDHVIGKSSIFQRMRTFSGSFFKALNTNKSS